MNQPEDHMDELFRKAGELYPLRTDGQNWDKVLAGLQEQPAGGASPVLAARRNFRAWRWLTLLLLLPIGWLTWNYTSSSNRHNEQSKAAMVSSDVNPGAGQAATLPAKAAANASAGQRPVSSGTGNAPAASTKGAAGSSIDVSVSAAALSVRGAKVPAGSVRTGNVPSRGSNASMQAFAQGGQNSAAKPAAAGMLGSASTQSTVSGQQPASNTNAAQGLSAFEWTPDAIAAANSRKTPDNLSQGAPAASQYPSGPQKANVTAHVLKVPSARVSGFYAGVLGGPDFSTVKFQEWQNPGYSIGILAGYRFNKKLAVEASALWDRKVYYTSGQYFDKKKAGIPSNWQVDDMNGNCNMFEIPVSLRWDFLAFKKGGLYATAGLSSYLMKQENYNYSATANSSTWNETKSYQNSGNNFLSIVHLSAGYTVPWGRVGDLRLEPYWKIPLTGVGIDNLPMSSLGLYVGLTHSFR